MRLRYITFESLFASEEAGDFNQVTEDLGEELGKLLCTSWIPHHTPFGPNAEAQRPRQGDCVPEESGMPSFALAESKHILRIDKPAICVQQSSEDSEAN